MATYEPQSGMQTMTGEERMRTSEGTKMAAGTVGAGGYGRVILTIKSVHNLRDVAWIGKSNPYVEVKIADATISTHHVSNAGDSASFDESFAFNNVAPNDVMEIHVYDKNKIRKDSHMGEGTITLRQVFESGRLETRVPLTTRTGTKDAGEVWITMRMEEGGTGGGAYSPGLTEKSSYETGYSAGQKGYEGSAMQTTTTAGGGTTAPQAEVCGQERFTTVQDVPVVRQVVETYKEHRPLETMYVTETKPVGQRELPGETEHLGTQTRIISEAEPRAPCE